MTCESNPSLQQLLSSNLIPSAYQAAYFQLQINDIASQILQLRAKLVEFEDQLRLHRAVLSPVRRIPTEILGEIFVWLLPDASEHGFRDRLVTVQLVCKSWRNAARIKHQLWAALRFKDITNVPSKKIEQWLHRAGSIPKSLIVSAQPHEDCADQSVGCRSLQSSALADLLWSLKGTLYHLSLEYRSPECFQNLLKSMDVARDASVSPDRCPWDSLESITLEFKDEWSESLDSLQSMFLHLPPKITSLELRLPPKWSSAFEDGGISTDTLSLPLPQNMLGRLSSLTLSCNWDGTRWLEDTLTHCVNVETLTMDFGGVYWDYQSDLPQTERILSSGLLLPKVRILRLQNISPFSIDILYTLKTPQLVELDIGFDRDDDDEDLKLSETVLSFVERSQCNTALRTLRLRYVHTTGRDLVATLRGLTSLNHLTLDGIDTRNSASPFYLLRLGPELSVPHLEALELLNLRPEFPPYSFLEFLRSRRPYHMNDTGEPVFTNPQDSFKRLKVTYQTTEIQDETLGVSDVIQVLRKWGGVSVNIGPIVYE